MISFFWLIYLIIIVINIVGWRWNLISNLYRSFFLDLLDRVCLFKGFHKTRTDRFKLGSFHSCLFLVEMAMIYMWIVMMIALVTLNYCFNRKFCDVKRKLFVLIFRWKLRWSSFSPPLFHSQPFRMVEKVFTQLNQTHRTPFEGNIERKNLVSGFQHRCIQFRLFIVACVFALCHRCSIESHQTMRWRWRGTKRK